LGRKRGGEKKEFEVPPRPYYNVQPRPNKNHKRKKNPEIYGQDSAGGKIHC